MAEVINGILINEVETKNIMTKSGLPVGGYSVNPYVGCTHACKYCYASFMKRFSGHTDEALSFTQKLTESIAVEMSAINTNHPVVNAILNQKYRSMQEKHIAVILKVGDLQEICLEEEEIVILLSNLLDNAIRESEKVLKNTGKAVIHLKLECEDHKLIFAVRNPVTEKVEIENDTIKSKRGDHHGIGMLNVKAVVDKYGGDMVLSCDENEFKAVVIL